LLLWQEQQEAQKIGLPSELIHELRPNGDMKYTLTPVIIESIFIHHPKSLYEIRKKNADGVCSQESVP
jgi:hypothetical protein